VTWNAALPSLITAAVAFAGIGFGSRLSTRRETLHWTREQRLKADAELLTAVDACYSAFNELAALLAVLEYPKTALVEGKVSKAVAAWRKGCDEIDRCLPLVELVASERLIEYLPRIRTGLRTHHLPLVTQVIQGEDLDTGEWEHLSRVTFGALRDVRWALRLDLVSADSFTQKASDRLWWFHRTLRRVIGPR
jgi:hypothetical protein